MTKQKKNTVQAGRLLSDNGVIQVYELETSIESQAVWNTGAFDQVTAAFSRTHVALRVARGQYEGVPQTYQVIVPREVFLCLQASYRAFERAEKNRLAPAPDDFDPFIDANDLP